MLPLWPLYCPFLHPQQPLWALCGQHTAHSLQGVCRLCQPHGLPAALRSCSLQSKEERVCGCRCTSPDVRFNVESA